MSEPEHIPVMLSEVLQFLNCTDQGNVEKCTFKGLTGFQQSQQRLYLDVTVGGGGHALAILKASTPHGRLIGMDCDSQALFIAKQRLAKFGERAQLVAGDFGNLPEILNRFKISKIDGIVADLGVSSLQLNLGERGFSFKRSGPLDMRMNPSLGENLAQLLEEVTEEKLAEILWKYGQEPHSRAIAKKICQGRLTSTDELAKVIAEVVNQRAKFRRGKKSVRYKIHPATRSFMALRIWVNGELDKLNLFLKQAPEFLKIGGRLLIISYHSLEDRLVKQSFKEWAKLGIYKVVTRKPLSPTLEEVARNPRARSAKLRVLERVL